MPNPNLSIMLVTAVPGLAQQINAGLQSAGYQEARCVGFDEARGELAEQPVSVLVTEGGPGLQLASYVRQQDEIGDHYTYIVLISEQPPAQLLDEDSGHGIDEVIAPDAPPGLILARLLSIDRLSSQMQRLREENRLLRDNIASLEQRNLVDSLTGLGNARYLQQKLSDSLRQVQSRGGAVCYLLVGIERAQDLRRLHGDDFHHELMHSVARRLQQMVRPLDVLVRLDDQHFVLLTLLANLQDCAPSSFKRLHDGLNGKGFQTRQGLLQVSAGISLVGLDSQSLPLDPRTLFDEARALLAESYARGVVNAKRMPKHLG